MHRCMPGGFDFMVNNLNGSGLKSVSISIFGSLRDKVGSKLAVEVPEEGLQFAEMVSHLNKLYMVKIEEYLEAPQVIILYNGRRLHPGEGYSTLLKRGDAILITVAISGG